MSRLTFELQEPCKEHDNPFPCDECVQNRDFIKDLRFDEGGFYGTSRAGEMRRILRLVAEKEGRRDG